jgi:outer membrane protein assembly factor BamA
MRRVPWTLFFALLVSAASLSAECVNDNRSNKNGGILITDFTINGTRTISTTDLAGITSDMIGSCFNEDSEEMEERIRASFQDRGYFKAEVKNLRVKPSDSLSIPKPVTLEGEVSEGVRYTLGEITFIENHAFSSERLREQFPLKRGDVFKRDKVASGLGSLRKLYGTRGFLDFTAIPATNLGTNGTASLDIAIQEGRQYHMGKLDIVADKEVASRLRGEWKLAEGDVYDQTYIYRYLEANRDLLPMSFSTDNVQRSQNCPDALVGVRVIIDPDEDTSHAEPKDVPCKEPPDSK